jgi:hypothetical protein
MKLQIIDGGLYFGHNHGKFKKPNVARYGLRVIKGNNSHYNTQLGTRNTTKFIF